MTAGQSVRPAFLITIDTEGDNLWAKPAITTENERFLPRFQTLCERYGFKPTYLTNYEMAVSPGFQEFGRDVVARGTGEIGMHLHAWNSPPLVPLTGNDFETQPYLIEYPDTAMREKIHFMTALLEDVFGVEICSHRAGRWSIDERYVRMLITEGYVVDCSVTPGVSWAGKIGHSRGSGGTDFRHFPSTPYFVDPSNIACPGESPLLEVPMTIVPLTAPPLRQLFDRIDALPGALRRAASPLRSALRRRYPTVSWLRPTGRNRSQLLRTLQHVRAEGASYAEFMLHSSELMPGGSPTTPAPRDVEAVYDGIEALFDAAHGDFEGATLSEFHDAFLAAARG